MILIEFLGLPGVGKSTIKKKIYESISIQNDSLYTNNDIKSLSKIKFYYNFIAKIISSRKSISLLIKCYFYGNIAIKRFKILFKQLAYFHIISNQKHTFILDQGILQALWALYTVDNSFKSYGIDNLKLPKINKWKIVYIYSNINDVVERKINRKVDSFTDFDNLNRDQLKEMYHCNNKYFEQIIDNDVLKECYIIKYENVNNQDNHKKLLEELDL